MTTTKTHKITANDVHRGDLISKTQEGPFERVTVIDDFPTKRTFWFGRQPIGSSRPGTHSIRKARTAAVWVTR